jgi:hypothetical protein
VVLSDSKPLIHLPVPGECRWKKGTGHSLKKVVVGIVRLRSDNQRQITKDQGGSVWSLVGRRKLIDFA